MLKTLVDVFWRVKEVIWKARRFAFEAVCSGIKGSCLVFLRKGTRDSSLDKGSFKPREDSEVEGSL